MRNVAGACINMVPYVTVHSNAMSIKQRPRGRSKRRGKALAETTANERFGRIRAFWSWAARKRHVDQFPTCGCVPEPEKGIYILEASRLMTIPGISAQILTNVVDASANKCKMNASAGKTPATRQLSELQPRPAKPQGETMSEKIYIGGNTYAVKDQLKKLGCLWDAGRKSWYTTEASVAERAKAIVGGQPPLNSPPPADLVGDAQPADLAAKYGREAVAGAKVTEWTVYGLAKGEQPKPNGSIRLVKGKRYVQVAHTARRYMSRDMLEDFDLFNAKPGGSYQWSGVEIVATSEEVAADKTKADAKQASADAPKAWDAAVALINQPASCSPAWVSAATCIATWGKPAMVHTGSYPTIHIGEAEVYYHVPSYFACDWDYEAVHRTAPLSDDLREKILAAVAACKQHGFLKAS